MANRRSARRGTLPRPAHAPGSSYPWRRRAGECARRASAPATPSCRVPSAAFLESPGCSRGNLSARSGGLALALRRAQAQPPADGVGQIGPIEGVEMKAVDALGAQALALLDGDRAGG